MRKVIMCNKPIDNAPAYLNDLNEKSIIGFLISCGDKFFITSTRDYYVVVGKNNFTTDIKQNFIKFEDMVKSLNVKASVYLFDSFEELVDWLRD